MISGYCIAVFAVFRIQAELSRLEQQEVSIRQGYDDIMQQALQVCAWEACEYNL